MDLAALIAQVEASRLRRVDVSPAVTMTFEVPSVYTVQAMVMASRRGVEGGDELVRLIGQQLRSWAGITTAMLLGQGVGSDDAAEYDARLWRVLAGREPALVTQLATEMIRATQADTDAAGVISGN